MQALCGLAVFALPVGIAGLLVHWQARNGHGRSRQCRKRRAVPEPEIIKKDST